MLWIADSPRLPTLLAQWPKPAEIRHRLQLRGQWRLCTAFPVSPLNGYVRQTFQFVAS